jgi:uncharacterized protein YkwD
MSGTPPHGPAATFRVPLRAPFSARWAIPLLATATALALVLALAASPARAQAVAACPAATETLGAATGTTVEAAVSCLVNAERTARGLAAVEPATALGISAQRHAVDMVARRYFAHVSPSGGTVDKRARRAGYITSPCWVLGEDLGWSPPAAATAATVVAAWMASPKHREVILTPSFRDIGVGIVSRSPVGDGTGATFVLELGALTRCGSSAAAAPRARPRSS